MNSSKLLPKVILLLFTIILASCRQISYSPFDAQTEAHHISQKSLSQLAALESTISYPFKVAVISDTHNDYDELENIISYINDHRDEYAFIIHAGDITTYATKREFELFKRIIEKSARPILIAVGNHDLIANGKTLFKKYFGDFSQFVTFKNISVAILSNNNWEMTGAPDYNWLEAKLSASTATRQIIVMHIPPLQEERFSKEQRDRILNIADNPALNVKYLISGHIHSKSKIVDFGSNGARHLDAGQTTANSYFLTLEFTATDINEDTIRY